MIILAKDAGSTEWIPILEKINAKGKTIKFLEENIREYSSISRISKYFFKGQL